MSRNKLAKSEAKSAVRVKARRLLPTSAPIPIPPQFFDKFFAHGWTRCENIWGKGRVEGWIMTLGPKRMAEARKRYQREQAEQRLTDRARSNRYTDSAKVRLRAVRAGERGVGV